MVTRQGPILWIAIVAVAVDSQLCSPTPDKLATCWTSSDYSHRLTVVCSYGFVVYMDPGVTDVACAGLNGMRMGERTLTVRRATEVIHTTLQSGHLHAVGGCGAVAVCQPPAGMSTARQLQSRPLATSCLAADGGWITCLVSLQHNRDANQPTNMGIQPAAAPAMPPMMPEAPPSRIIRCLFTLLKTMRVSCSKAQLYLFRSLGCRPCNTLQFGTRCHPELKQQHLLVPYSIGGCPSCRRLQLELVQLARGNILVAVELSQVHRAWLNSNWSSVLSWRRLTPKPWRCGPAACWRR